MFHCMLGNVKPTYYSVEEYWLEIFKKYTYIITIFNTVDNAVIIIATIIIVIIIIKVCPEKNAYLQFIREGRQQQ